MKNRCAKDVLGCLALVGLALALFLPTLGYDFVNWDDPWYVLNNPLISSWRPANLWAIATQPAVRNYAPLTMFGYLIQHSLWGNWVGGYHLVNVLLHAVNAVLVYVLIRQLSGNRFIAWTTAALFAAHPVQVETVAWISSFKGTLSGSFILAGLICWLRPARTPREEGFGILFHALGLLSKALGITVPAIVFVYDVFVGKKRPAEAMARQAIPCVLGVLVLLVTMSAQTAEVGGVRNHLGWSKARIAAVDSVILWKYVGLTVWPHDLCVLYDPPTEGIAATILLASGGWIAVASAAVQTRRRYPFVLLGLVSFGCLLFPVLNFFPITTLINDRYLYLPSIPIFALMAVGLDQIAAAGRVQLGPSSRRQTGLDVRRHDRPAERQVASILSRSFAGATCAVLLLGYVVATQERLPVWRNDSALWNDAIQKSPGLSVVRIQWATSLHNDKKKVEALAALERALVETRPDAADRERMLATIAEWKSDAAPLN
jgi:protein O-mannosyl-transferase